MGKQYPPKAWYFARAGEIYQWTGSFGQAKAAFEKAQKVEAGNFGADRAAKD